MISEFTPFHSYISHPLNETMVGVGSFHIIGTINMGCFFFVKGGREIHPLGNHPLGPAPQVKNMNHTTDFESIAREAGRALKLMGMSSPPYFLFFLGQLV